MMVIIPCSIPQVLVYLLYAQWFVSPHPIPITFPPPLPLPAGNYLLVFCVCESVLRIFVYICLHLFILLF